MKISDFKKLYNPFTKCYVKCKLKNNDRIEGLIIDVQGSINKDTSIYINNFYQKINIKDIEVLTITKQKWGV